MSSVVLDSSVVLAFLQEEPGAEKVMPLLGDAMMSTVNLAEVVTKLIGGGGCLDTARQDIDRMKLRIMEFTEQLAEDAGELVVRTKKQGLSLGDRACLALARRERLPVMTADRSWKDLDVGVKIEVIR